jgi:hypothetical protein
MPPLYLLMFAIVLTLAVAAKHWRRRGRLQCQLKRLAVERQLHFSPHDQLRLGDRVAAAFPVPGAAYVQVVDLLYGSQRGSHRYVFTAQYTLGAVRSKKRVRRAATFDEPRDRSPGQCCQVRLATASLPLLEQYRELLS